MKTIQTRTWRRRKDGTYSNQSAWTRTPVIARIGAWAITPFNVAYRGFSKSQYIVTHVPSGRCIGCSALTLSQAKRVLALFAALPDQARWRRLKNYRHMTKAMRAAGRALSDQVRS